MSETLTQVFCCEFCENSKHTFFTEYLQTTTSVGRISYEQSKIDRVFFKIKKKRNRLKGALMGSSLAWKVFKYVVFLVHIFPYLDWIWRFTSSIFVFSPNMGKYAPQNLCILDNFYAVRIILVIKCEKWLIARNLFGIFLCTFVNRVLIRKKIVDTSFSFFIQWNCSEEVFSVLSRYC